MKRWALIFLLLAAAACGMRSHSDIPALRAGKDVCSHCGMIISDERLASGYVDDEGQNILFDDLGELFSALSGLTAKVQEKAYVHDAVGGAWIKAQSAYYLRLPGLPTPMGSGIIAFKDSRAAADFARRSGFPGAAASDFKTVLASFSNPKEPAATSVGR